MKSHLLLLLILSAALCPLRAQDHGWPVAAQVSVPDLQVVTQTGDHLRFNSEVIKGRVAIVTGFFTTCSSMCPITQENLAHVAKQLGPRLGKDVVIVSLSVDASHDTPQRMKAWGEKFHIGRGWVLAGGNKAEVDTLLKSLGLFVDIPQRHQSALMVGSEATGWVRVSSWTSPEKLIKLVDTISSIGHGAPAASTSSASK
ncbi:MAG TPA: SCO family protein [Candidatus Angelobacter sp.]|jgi:cytochrome oxidase Cu insertion factor (SCO1/SenC/PrrC family)